MKICAFFGHRQCFGLDEKKLETVIERVVCEYGCTTFWFGGMGAFDRLAARKTREMKKRYPQIHMALVYAYLPGKQTEDAKLYDESILPAGMEAVPRHAAIPRRNAWMTSRCDMAIAFVDVTQGGAYAAVENIRKAGKPVLNIGSLRLE